MFKTIKEDRMHIDFPMKNKEREFEWWYFDAALDNGDHLVVMYSINDTRLKPRQPSVRTNIYEKNGNEIWELKKYDETEVSVNYAHCDVKLGEEFCIDRGEYYELYTNINGNGAHLKFYPINNSWTKPASKNLMGWTVAIPYGRVEGVLIKNGVEESVKGTGYHDHNWGTKSMGGIFKNWYWGKVHTEDLSIDYSVLMTKKMNIPVTAILITDKNGVLVEPTTVTTLFNTHTTLKNKSKEEEMGFNIAHQLNIKVKKKGFKMDLTIDLDHFVMKEKAQFIPGESVYRYIGKEKMVIAKDGEKRTYTTASLHEIVFLLER